jgi:hypothetical protein
MKIKLLFLLICICAGFSCVGQKVFTLDGGQKELILPINKLEFFEDSLKQYSFEEVIDNTYLFKVHDDFSPVDDFHASSAYWIKLNLNIPPSEVPWIMEFYDQTLDHIEVYKPKAGEGYEKIILGDLYPFSNKPLQHKNFEVFVDSDDGRYQTFYIKVESHQNSDVRIAIKALDRFIQYSLYEYYLYGLFYGMILIISLYNLLIYAAIREVKYLFYAFYILSVGLYAACVDGIAYQFLWPSLPAWNKIAHGVSLFLLIFWALLFARAFLNTRERLPVYHKWLNYIIIARVVLFIYALLFQNELFQYRHIEIIPLSFIFYLSILILIRGYKPARFFVAAYGFLFLGFLLKALLTFEVIPFSILSYYSLHLCFLIEMLLLTFALSDRVRILKKIRDRALQRIIEQHKQNARLKDKVNRELEVKIRERTVELEEKNRMLSESNQKLNEQAREINRMNSLLGKDNWKLQRNIKEVLQDRLFNKDLSYAEFTRIFPDELSCHRFLHKLKWDKGYNCHKCGNTKFSDGKAKLSRRCSRCGYEESITSNTLFHRLKFPIEKAFYILYLINNKRSGYTLDDLSRILDLRRNTIWSFKKKVEKMMEDKRYTKTGTRPDEFFVGNNA